MDLYGSRPFTRRAFLWRGLTLASAASTAPAFLTRSAFALAQDIGNSGTGAGIPEDRVLVVLQLAGGNDGLNTVVPYGDAMYYRARPALAVAESQAIRLSKADGFGLHPALSGLASMYDEGLVSVVQGVGYPNPNRSHFKSMDIWHTADTNGTGDGWLGRYFDNQCSGAPSDCQAHSGIAIGRSAPPAMQGRRHMPVSFESADLFRWAGMEVDEALAEPYRAVMSEGSSAEVARGSNAEFLMRTAMDAHVSSEQVRAAVGLRPLAEYPRTPLARQLAMVAAMIRAGLRTRVYYVSHGGFDTHAGQGNINGTHANLLRQLGDAVRAFYADLGAQGNDGRVLTMTFSEFGRRVSQNGSNGTDHGTAAPMFLMGPMVRPGVIGRHPSLTDLDEGDLRFTADFRNVYAAVLKDWLRTDGDKVLGGRYRAASVIRG